jgi:hypothetical protein
LTVVRMGTPARQPERRHCTSMFSSNDALIDVSNEYGLLESREGR